MMYLWSFLKLDDAHPLKPYRETEIRQQTNSKTPGGIPAHILNYEN